MGKQPLLVVKQKSINFKASFLKKNIAALIYKYYMDQILDLIFIFLMLRAYKYIKFPEIPFLNYFWVYVRLILYVYFKLLSENIGLKVVGANCRSSFHIGFVVWRSFILQESTFTEIIGNKF